MFHAFQILIDNDFQKLARKQRHRKQAVLEQQLYHTHNHTGNNAQV